MLKRYNNVALTKPQYSPHVWVTPMYGQKRQYAKTMADLPTLSDGLTNLIQQKTDTSFIILVQSKRKLSLLTLNLSYHKQSLQKICKRKYMC